MPRFRTTTFEIIVLTNYRKRSRPDFADPAAVPDSARPRSNSRAQAMNRHAVVSIARTAFQARS